MSVLTAAVGFAAGLAFAGLAAGFILGFAAACGWGLGDRR